MRSYTLHLAPDARQGDAEVLDRAMIVPDGFSWPAFAFSVLWFLFHRLWIAALIVLAGLVVLALGGYALGLPRTAGVAIALLASVLIGLEASSLRRWTLARRGWPARDAVVARDRDEAEARLFARWADPAHVPPPPQPPRSSLPGGFARRADAVIGLFPNQEGAR
jgi:hypothetical protein